MRKPVVGIILATVLSATGVAGCISTLANSPLVIEHLQVVSAGHTGCLPADNAISNVSAKADGSGVWNATCKGKTYLCSAAGSTGNSESFSCAPVAQ
jgi:hypothetical protein